MHALRKGLFKAGASIKGHLFLVDGPLPQEYEKVEAKQERIDAVELELSLEGK